MDLPRVMHIDDEPDIREIALIALETVGGLSVVQCASGEEAIAMAPDWQPDVFVIDVMMPGMTGVETFHALRAMSQFSTTPMIFLTAKAQVGDLDILREVGADAVMTKPFDPMTLAERVIEVWRGTRPDG
ncbi:response regulator [Solirhodobacter olei]|uniref:response regulator n=1 Tax=Solirhodobacter olei TaxID=2493082 RepID=UPI000FD94B73|nr:response regulator [Solirhodobacter olei]